MIAAAVAAAAAAGTVAPVPYVLLVGTKKVPDGITEDESLEQILHWIGFRTEELKNALFDDAFG